ncbi:MAG TPA: hypothetical protein EYP30_09935 [Archaeoglobaceae archaeon]|nr:hypothetical protein [Archaeoglobaceae archaeon]
MFISSCIREEPVELPTTPQKIEEVKTEIETKQSEVETQVETQKIQAKKIPDSIESNCIGFVVGGEEEIKLIAQIGGAWVRPHPGPFQWGWIETEKVILISAEQTNGLKKHRKIM